MEDKPAKKVSNSRDFVWAGPDDPIYKRGCIISFSGALMPRLTDIEQGQSQPENTGQVSPPGENEEKQ